MPFVLAVIFGVMLFVYCKNDAIKKRSIAENYYKDHPGCKIAEEELLAFKYFLRTRTDMSRNPYTRAMNLSKKKIVSDGFVPIGWKNVGYKKAVEANGNFVTSPQKYSNESYELCRRFCQFPTNKTVELLLRQDKIKGYGEYLLRKYYLSHETYEKVFDEYQKEIYALRDALKKLCEAFEITDEDLKNDFYFGKYAGGFDDPSKGTGVMTIDFLRRERIKWKPPVINEPYKKWLREMQEIDPI